MTMDEMERKAERIAWSTNNATRKVRHCHSCGRALAFSSVHQMWVHRPGQGAQCEWIRLNKAKASK